MCQICREEEANEEGKEKERKGMKVIGEGESSRSSTDTEKRR